MIKAFVCPSKIVYGGPVDTVRCSDSPEASLVLCAGCLAAIVPPKVSCPVGRIRCSLCKDDRSPSSVSGENSRDVPSVC